MTEVLPRNEVKAHLSEIVSRVVGQRHSARRRTCRVLYRIDESRKTVTVLTVIHRSEEVWVKSD